MNIGKILKDARESKKLTLKELSAKTGISYISLGSYERDKSRPKAPNLCKICEALDLDYDKLFKTLFMDR